MDNTALVLLGLIAAGSLVQAGFLITLALSGFKLAKRVEVLQGRVDNDLRPALADVNRLTKNLADASELATAQVRRVETLITGAVMRIEDTREQIRDAVTAPLYGPMSDVLALIRSVRRGVDVYRRLGGLEAQERGRARRYKEDEHLFI